jgi:hypothetical protein
VRADWVDEKSDGSLCAHTLCYLWMRYRRVTMRDFRWHVSIVVVFKRAVELRLSLFLISINKIMKNYTPNSQGILLSFLLLLLSSRHLDVSGASLALVVFFFLVFFISLCLAAAVSEFNIVRSRIAPLNDLILDFYRVPWSYRLFGLKRKWWFFYRIKSKILR